MITVRFCTLLKISTTWYRFGYEGGLYLHRFRTLGGGNVALDLYVFSVIYCRWSDCPLWSNRLFIVFTVLLIDNEGEWKKFVNLRGGLKHVGRC